MEFKEIIYLSLFVFIFIKIFEITARLLIQLIFMLIERFKKYKMVGHEYKTCNYCRMTSFDDDYHFCPICGRPLTKHGDLYSKDEMVAEESIKVYRDLTEDDLINLVNYVRKNNQIEIRSDGKRYVVDSDDESDLTYDESCLFGKLKLDVVEDENED